MAGDSVWLVAALASIIIVLPFWLWPGGGEKLRVIGKVFIFSGLIVGAGAGVGKFAGEKALSNAILANVTQARNISASVNQILSTITTDLMMKFIMVAAVLFIFGIALRLVSHLPLATTIARIITIILLIASLGLGFSAINNAKKQGLFDNKTTIK